MKQLITKVGLSFILCLLPVQVLLAADPSVPTTIKSLSVASFGAGGNGGGWLELVLADGRTIKIDRALTSHEDGSPFMAFYNTAQLAYVNNNKVVIEEVPDSVTLYPGYIITLSK